MCSLGEKGGAYRVWRVRVRKTRRRRAIHVAKILIRSLSVAALKQRNRVAASTGHLPLPSRHLAGRPPGLSI